MGYKQPQHRNRCWGCFCQGNGLAGESVKTTTNPMFI